MTLKKRKKKTNTSKKIFIIILLLVSLLIILLIVEFDILKIIKNSLKEPQLIEIEDECIFMAGNLVHQIREDGECKTMCRNECALRDKKYNRHGFVENINTCNICNCYCK